MTSLPRTVFVLGAGFTRAVLPRAPLLIDDYYTVSLAGKFETLPHARRLLDLERSNNLDGRINIERLMTRIEGGMPYDIEQGVREELGLLLVEVKRSFERRLEDAKTGPRRDAELGAFAAYCVLNRVTCITFNYDDILDQALWEHASVRNEGGTSLYWHPDGGYGFFCRPSESIVVDASTAMDRTSMFLLKLHGSINWRVKRGHPRPYSIDAIVHHEPWLPVRDSFYGARPEDIVRHLELESFIVPPVLVKSSLVEQPILRLIWSLAYTALQEADQVTFVGYSLPVTDIAAGFLFGEAIRKGCEIKVVNLAQGEGGKKTIEDSYRRVFPEIAGKRFEFRDALDWSREVVGGSSGPQASSS